MCHQQVLILTCYHHHQYHHFNKYIFLFGIWALMMSCEPDTFQYDINDEMAIQQALEYARVEHEKVFDLLEKLKSPYFYYY